ncbi:uncharacterized protein LOC127840849 [Dreissena polymorpha]|uniref:PX domain-containing protein n=1 Tax=Dreissena polymorpha TaxID=45954 RepID=A0A9D4F085_DREPO|nr:uncharacterized protein LOC127840849 [Dreissena polymorpha]KAH3788939.1 hypothetical protein DPMN_167103 [Dreissena polymorpha]
MQTSHANNLNESKNKGIRDKLQSILPHILIKKEICSLILNQNMYEAVSTNNASVVYAAVTGFVEKKSKYWFTDYQFVVEVYWTNKRTTFIKRSYSDVLRFQDQLLDYFSERLQKGLIKTPVYIPRLQGKRVFQLRSVELAEQQETELQKFFRDLIGGNPLISGNKIVTDFLNRWPTDPVPSADEIPEEDDEDDVLFDR